MNGCFKSDATSDMDVIYRKNDKFREGMKKNSNVEKHGHGNWSSVTSKAGLQRYRKSCRLRWINNLKPEIKRGNFSFVEDLTIVQLHAPFGNKWLIIASHLSKKTNNEIMNNWNTNVKKRFIRMGMHSFIQPKGNTFEAYGGHQSKEVDNNMSNMAQWESAQFEVLTRESMLQVGFSSFFLPVY